MMKSAKTSLVVESVDKAIKFYSERLGFDLVEVSVEKDGESFINYAQLKKGKAFLILRSPSIDELAEFSMIKRCSGRGAGMYVEMKKGIESFYARCQKKNLTIFAPLKAQPWGDQTFVIKDPFGLRLVFSQPITNFKPENPYNFCGMNVPSSHEERVRNQDTLMEDMIKWLRGFGILRRVSKKYAKDFLKHLNGPKKK